MGNEKIMILKMLEEGKIGADEAAKLLTAIKGDNEETKIEPNIEPKINKVENQEANKDQNNQTSNSKNVNLDKLGKTMGIISKSLAKKVGVLAKEMAPKIKTITESLVEKTVLVTDKLAKSVSESPSKSSTEYKTPPVRTTPSTVYRTNEKSCEIGVVPGSNNELYISAKSGVIYIKGYNGDKITAKITYNSTTSNIELSRSGSRYYLDYDDSEFKSVSIEAFVPERLFNRFQISAKDSKVSLDGIHSNEILVETFAAGINLKNLESDYIKAITDKGEVYLENIISGSLEVITANGKVDAIQLDVGNLKIETDNAPINYKTSTLKNHSEYSWKISTSNATMRINLPISEEIGYDIKANTSLNTVSAGIAGLQYAFNESSYIEAKTLNFSKAHKTVKASFDTSNAPININ